MAQETADLLVVGYGITSRILRSAVAAARSQGLRVGLFRPITLWPFPAQALAKVAADVEKVLVVELSNGQMVEDVRLALNGKVPVEFYGRSGRLMLDDAPTEAEYEGNSVLRGART